MKIESIDPTEEHPIRAVVVDDDADVRFLLSTIMELDGRFDVVGEAHSAAAGIALVSDIRPDLVLVDLQMGRQDGTWLIKQLRSRNSVAALAVVTGSGSGSEHAAALEAGADSVHNKGSMTSTMADDLAATVAARTATLGLSPARGPAAQDSVGTLRAWC